MWLSGSSSHGRHPATRSLSIWDAAGEHTLEESPIENSSFHVLTMTLAMFFHGNAMLAIPAPAKTPFLSTSTTGTSCKRSGR